MVDAELAKNLDEALRRLYSYRGVQQINLERTLGDELIRRFHVKPTDSSTDVRKKVRSGLKNLIERFDEDNQIIALYAFNITDNSDIEGIVGVTERLKELPSVSASSAYNKLTGGILPELVRDLINNPPDPMPEPPQAAEVAVSAELTTAEPMADGRDLQQTPPSAQPKADEKTTPLQQRPKGALVAAGSITGGLLVIAAIVVLVITLNSSDPGGSTSRAGNGQTQAPPTQDPPITSEGEGLPQMVFDDLSYAGLRLMTYPGVSDSVADQQANGAYEDGTVVSLLGGRRRTTARRPRTPRRSGHAESYEPCVRPGRSAGR